jgi:hypothetical protein
MEKEAEAMRVRRRPSERQNERADVMDFGGVWMRHVDRKCAESSPARMLTLQLIHVQYCFQSPVRCASGRLVMCNRNTNRARHKSVPEAESARIQCMVGGKPTRRVRGKGRMIGKEGDSALVGVRHSTAGDGSARAA